MRKKPVDDMDEMDNGMDEEKSMDKNQKKQKGLENA